VNGLSGIGDLPNVEEVVEQVPPTGMPLRPLREQGDELLSLPQPAIDMTTKSSISMTVRLTLMTGGLPDRQNREQSCSVDAPIWQSTLLRP
jgi:hypothetical protein